MSPAAVEIRGVWKIFGERSLDALEAIRRDGISKRDVQKKFGCVVGVQNASFSVMEGEVFCIMGLSGSGKSTLVRHINRLLEPTAGDIFIGGENVMDKDAGALRLMRAEKTGMVFQNIALLPHRTVIDNVALPLDVKGISRSDRRETAMRVLSLVELSGWENHYAHELSGGMQQRVGLARAMAGDPDILLMDEPFSALDPLIRRQLQDEFIQLTKATRKTTIFITHDLDEAIRVGHRIAIMKDGVLVQTGTAEEIVSHPVDEYVADFVAGISRLKLISAHSIMVPVSEYRDASAEELVKAPRENEDADLDRLIDISVQHKGPIVITQSTGREVGVIDKDILLRGIQGGKNESLIRVSDQNTQYSPADAHSDNIADFVGVNSKYYEREIARLDTATGFIPSFNVAAALLGSIWWVSRHLWSWFWIFLIFETIAIVQIARGLLADLGAGQLARAGRLAASADRRRSEAEELIANGDYNVNMLLESASALDVASADAFVKASELDATAPYLLAFGIGFLVLLRVVQGLLANRVMNSSYRRWCADKSVSHGVSGILSFSMAIFVILTSVLTSYRFTVGAPPKWLETFPAERSFRRSFEYWIDSGFQWLTENWSQFFQTITGSIKILLNAMETLLVATPWPVVMAVISLLALKVAGPRVAIFTAATLAYLSLFGFWEKSMSTVALLGSAAVLCIVIGIPLGVACARKQSLYSVVRPILDLMQTMPTFVYLIPVIAFFGIGKPPGILATIVFGMPPVIRLTVLGLQGVPASVREAADAFGVSKSYMLFKVDLPLAMPSIMAGINQTILMCLTMVVIASLIGAKGLGEEVLDALTYANEGQGVLAGLAILFCAMVLDRIVQGRAEK